MTARLAAFALLGLLSGCADSGTAPGAGQGGSGGGAGSIPSPIGGAGGAAGGAGQGGSPAPDAGADAAQRMDAGDVASDARVRSCGGDTFTLDPETLPTDVVWVVGSDNWVLERRALLGARFDTLHQALHSRAAKGSVSVLSLFTDVWLAGQGITSDADYRLIDQQVTSSEMFQKALEHYDTYAPSLRSDAVTQFVFMGLLDSTYQGADAAARADNFVQDLSALLGAREHRIHAIVSAGEPGEAGCELVPNCCDGLHDTDRDCKHEAQGGLLPLPTQPMKSCVDGDFAAHAPEPGAAYRLAAEQGGGSLHSVCAQDWDALRDSLVDSLVAGAATCSYPLSGALISAELDTTELRTAAGVPLPRRSGPVSCADDVGYYREADRIVLCEASCASLRSQALSAQLDCE